MSKPIVYIVLAVVVAVVWGGFYAAEVVADEIELYAENFDSLDADPQLEDNAGWLGDDTDLEWMSELETVISDGPDRQVYVHGRQSPKTGSMVYADPNHTLFKLTEADQFSLSLNCGNAVAGEFYNRLGFGFYDSVGEDQKFQINLGGDQNWGINDPTDSYVSYPPIVMFTGCNGWTPASVLMEYFPSGNPGVDPGSVKLTLYDQEDLGGSVLCTGSGSDITWNNKESDGTLLSFEVDSVYITCARYGIRDASHFYDNSIDIDDLIVMGPESARVEPGEPIPGDANEDGMVTDADAAILATNWQQCDVGWSEGDFNADGCVTDADAAILATHWQEGVEGAAAVPEPSSLMLAAIGALCLAQRLTSRRRHQRC